MSKTLGLDISSNSTGWSIIELENQEKKLTEYGLIKPEGGMGVTQRLYFFGNELQKLIEKFQPNEITIEETVLARGFKAMRVLARFSGVALYLAYSYQKREVATYEPAGWKKAIGLGGDAKKPEVQLKICDEFNLIDKEKIEEYQKQLAELADKPRELRKTLTRETTRLTKDTNFAEKEFIRYKREYKKKKKKEVTEDDTKKYENLEKVRDEKKAELKIKIKEKKEVVKNTDKQYERISINIYSDCGLNNDIADSCGVALCSVYKKQLTKNETQQGI